MNFERFEARLGYSFTNKSLLKAAMTHRSYEFEHSSEGVNNQRLEFLGDAVLGFIMGETLYSRYPKYQEGELSRLRSRLVCEGALCQLAQKLGFDEFILMGKGEISVGGRCRAGTLADAYEAVIGAIYLDGGIDEARRFILKHHAEFLANPDGNWLASDAKTRLQEIVQGMAVHKELRYEVLNETGPVHAPTFEVAVLLDEHEIGRGIGRSKKEAQQSAAQDALARM